MGWQEYTPNPIAWRNDNDLELQEYNGMPSGISVNQYGHVKTVTRRAAPLLDQRTINASGETKVFTLEGAETAVVQMHAASAPVGFNMAFEATLDPDPTDAAEVGWFPVPAVRTSNGTAETTTGVLAAVPAYAWRIDTRGLSAIRLRVTAKTAGAEQVIVLVSRA